jgi:hypothetical protein
MKNCITYCCIKHILSLAGIKHTLIIGTDYIGRCDLIGGVIVSLVALSAIDSRFEAWSGQTKYYKFGTCLLGVTLLPADCCFGELALKQVCWSITKQTSSH